MPWAPTRGRSTRRHDPDRSPGTDDCAARATALPGSWYRIACTNTSSGCSGLLEAGTYPSQYIAPRLDIGGSWAPDLGAMTYKVPAGWANSSDWPNTFSLTPATDYALEGPDGPGAGVHEIHLFTQPFASIQDGACSDTADETVDRSVKGLVAWLRTLPSLKVSAASSDHRRRLRGGQWSISGSLVSWKRPCPGDTVPTAAFFARLAIAGERLRGRHLRR